MCDAPDTLRSVPDWTPLERLQHLRRIAREHLDALADGSVADIGGVPRLEFLGVFVRAESDAARLEARLRGEE